MHALSTNQIADTLHFNDKFMSYKKRDIKSILSWSNFVEYASLTYRSVLMKIGYEKEQENIVP